MSARVVDLVTPTREQCLQEAADVLVQAAIRIGRERHELAQQQRVSAASLALNPREQAESADEPPVDEIERKVITSPNGTE